MVKGNAPMPSCNKRDQSAILAAAARLRGVRRVAAESFIFEVGAREVCRLLHVLRRWYSAWSTGGALRGYRNVLSDVMDLRPPAGVFRGFKVHRNDPLAQAMPGDVLTLVVTRNSGCSSWTGDRARADKFSGATRDKIGLVVKLIDGRGVQTLVAPPEKTVPWFNELYTATMSGSHRNKEREYVVYAPRVRVEVVAVKRRGRSA